MKTLSFIIFLHPPQPEFDITAVDRNDVTLHRGATNRRGILTMEQEVEEANRKTSWILALNQMVAAEILELKKKHNGCIR